MSEKAEPKPARNKIRSCPLAGATPLQAGEKDAAVFIGGKLKAGASANVYFLFDPRAFTEPRPNLHPSLRRRRFVRRRRIPHRELRGG